MILAIILTFFFDSYSLSRLANATTFKSQRERITVPQRHNDVSLESRETATHLCRQSRERMLVISGENNHVAAHDERQLKQQQTKENAEWITISRFHHYAPFATRVIALCVNFSAKAISLRARRIA